MLWWFLHALTWIRHGYTCDVSWKECKVMWTLQLTREEAKSDQCAALLHRDGHGSCFRSCTRTPATCQAGGGWCLLSQLTEAQRPNQSPFFWKGSWWKPCTCDAASVRWHGVASISMSSPFTSAAGNDFTVDYCKRQLGWWQMQKAKPWLPESTQSSLLWRVSWFSRWYPHYKHWKEHSASAGQGTVWSTAVHLTPVSRKLLISEADPEADVIFLSICSGILSLPWLLAFAFLSNTWTLY